MVRRHADGVRRSRMSCSVASPLMGTSRHHRKTAAIVRQGSNITGICRRLEHAQDTGTCKCVALGRCLGADGARSPCDAGYIAGSAVASGDDRDVVGDWHCAAGQGK
jgi:hypothetical protein